MFALESPYLEPPCDDGLDRDKPAFIEFKIEEICESIAKKGKHSPFHEVFDYLYEYIEDNLEKFLPEQDLWELT